MTTTTVAPAHGEPAPYVRGLRRALGGRRPARSSGLRPGPGRARV